MPNKSLNFTKPALEALPLPDSGKRDTYHDTRVRGLVLRVTSAGAKTFAVYRRVDGQPTRVTIGSFPDLSVEQARRKAEELNGAIAQGENPNKRKKSAREEMTLQELLESFAQAKQQKKSLAYDQAQFRRYLGNWANKKLSIIERTDVRALHTKVGKDNGQYSANRLLALVRGLYNFAIEEGHFKGTNPAIGVSAFAEKTRERRLYANELPAFFDALAKEPNDTIRDYVLVSLLTGARKANVLTMTWAQLDFDRAVWMIPETKNGTPQTIPLTPPALEVLKQRSINKNGPYVFPGSGKTGHLAEPKTGWARILKNAGLQDLRLHDLRRTLGSWQIDTGASLAVIGRTLNHKSPAATAVYARLALDPVRESMEVAVNSMLKAGGAHWLAGDHAE